MIDREEKERILNSRRLNISARSIDSAKDMKERRNKYADLGLCAKCRHLHAETTRLGTKRYWCVEEDNRKKRITTDDPIVDCTDFWDVSHKTLKELIDMALPIDIKKRPIGFLREMDDWENIEMLEDMEDE